MTRLFQILSVTWLLGCNLLSAQIIKNGSFECASVNPGTSWRGLPVGSTAICDWIVSSGNIDYIGTYWRASDSSRSVDLNGNTAGSISQSFRTAKDSIYQVQFDLAGNPDGGPTLKRLRASAADTSQEFSFDTSGKNRQNMGWELATFEFTAVDTLTTLTFVSLVSGAYGPAIDNVRAIIKSPLSSNSIKVGVLYSYLASDTIFWQNLDTNWPQFGAIEIQIDFTTMIYDSVTYDSLKYNNFDVIIVDNALSQPFDPPIYSDAEVEAIERYTKDGHGLIVMGGTLRGNAALAPLLGYSLDAAGQVFYQTGIPDSISYIVNSRVLFDRLPQYKTFTSNFYSGRDWADDGGLGHRADWEKVLVAHNAVLVGMIWNSVSDELHGSPLSVLYNSKSTSIFCGHTPVNQVALPDDYQFVYNMIICASPDPSTSVKSVSANILSVPSGFKLSQNYPNPFNPETVILYELPQMSQVEVAIFNLLGERIRTLVTQRQAAGQHRLHWDGRNEFGVPVPSGVYLYRLRAGEFVQTRKMILMQ